ncbi:hypothetical protein [Planctellipticum variicoloris]|uniref:hypothetical protein n=1 Tax=Planctellipticum variicoloris TaxID=3064265 RepID=UPI003013AD5C|nr:hypothetical protein SH412_003258 [Planctomycetaceae bacterium SH412]
MSGGVFVLHDDGRLDSLAERPYDSEDLLQQLLAGYPDLLAGDQMDADRPRRWLLVSREMGIPGEEDGAGRWSLDHLFLDQDAIPTLVEVKRSSDSRIRREVVGQMLDYAANAVAYWPVETIRSRFEKTAEEQGQAADDVLAAFLEPEADPDGFWQTVKTNLQAGKVRLVFVADVIPDELRRVVEFLNGQMDPAEVLAVEVKQFVGDGRLKTLVPRLVGQTSAARQRKSSGGSTPKQQKVDEVTFLAVAREKLAADDLAVTRRLIAWAGEQGLTPNFNRYPTSASFIPIVETSAGPRYPLSVQSGGDAWVQMKWLRDSPPFNDERIRHELCDRLNAVPGLQVAPERMTGYPRVTLSILRDEAALMKFLDAMTWLVEKLRMGP